MRNRVSNEGARVYPFGHIARPRNDTIICGASKNCYKSDGCPDLDWYCGYQLGTEIIRKWDDEERIIDLNWDDSREEPTEKIYR